jgi:aldehyde:ferredoxin oxidoreductase
LTGGIKESNAGGDAADAMAGVGYRAVVFSGKFPADEPGLVIIETDGVRFLPAADYWGLDLEETASRLQTAFGEEYALVAIGPTGEALLPAAAIGVSDLRGDPFRFAARGGLAAVMGSKHLKAILIRKGRRTCPKGEAFRAAVRAFHQLVASNERVEVLRKYGTASTVMFCQELQALPTRNFRHGTFEEAEQLSGEALYELTVARGREGTPTERCMSACMIQCSNVYPDESGDRLVAPIEYETLGMCGSNLGIGDPDMVARLNRVCNELGLDTIEVGAALGVAAEAGLWRFGDGERAIELVQEIGKPTLLGRLLGQGCTTTGQVLGIRRVPAVKGQALGAYDPRGIKGMGVTFATSPMGGDHTAGLTIFAPLDHKTTDGQIELSRDTQITRAAYDALGLCVFLLGSTATRPDLVVDMLNAAYGTDRGPDALAQLGAELIAIERGFNHQAGLTTATDRLPDFFYDEPLSPHGEVFDIAPDALAHFWDASEED